MRGHFTDQRGGDHRVLIAHIAAGEVAIALFKSQHKAVVAFIQLFLDGFADELKASEHVIYINAVRLADGVRHAGGHDGLYRICAFFGRLRVQQIF